MRVCADKDGVEKRLLNLQTLGYLLSYMLSYKLTVCVCADKDGVEKRLLNLQTLGYVSAKYYS